MPTGSIATAGLSTAFGKIAGALAAAAALVVAMATATPPVRSVDKLEFARYAGTWFEVARLPDRRRARCHHDVTTTYRLQTDGSMHVVDRCVDDNERVNVSVGRASILGGDPARLRLSYVPPWLSWWPGTHAEQWVVLLDEDYRYAVLSDPSRATLRILARRPILDSSTYDGIVARLRAQRFPVERLVLTPQQVLAEPASDAARPRLIV